MVDVQWYPGHMEKARREMADHLKAVDMIIELRDARIPMASRNPILDEMAPQKPRLIILSKTDLADEAETKRWEAQLKGENRDCLALDIASDPSVKKQIIEACAELTKEKRNRMIRRGIRPRAMRAMACGIPNAGKSTLINRIAGRNRAKTADKPGVTRALTWIKADKTLEILDTPGVLWPKFETQRTGSLLAATGAINETILDLKEIAMDTIHVIRERYPMVLETEYDAEADVRTDVLLERIAEKRHLRKDNDEPDIDRAASLFLHELRRGKLGRLTLESADSYESEKNMCK
ncbi:MAG: ribosome biogenesis GTPase YlqF [Solobacterium sp.]|nr:ribosome biogenesis GTPase YlqF [Solobacterium sp.]